MPTSKTQFGFTLVELLVVVFILGLLATIVVVAVGTSRSAARDSQRKSDLATLSNTFENFYTGERIYPIPDGHNNDTVLTWFTMDNLWNNNTGFNPILALKLKKYLGRPPQEPLDNQNKPYKYSTYHRNQVEGKNENGLCYRVITDLENSDDADINDVGSQFRADQGYPYPGSDGGYMIRTCAD